MILVLVNLMWAAQFSAAKIATDHLGPITVTVVTLAMSVALMTPVLALKRTYSPAGLGRGGFRRNVARFFLLSAAGIVISQLFLTWGIARSLASNAAVITLATPVNTAVLAFFLLGERMTRLRWISFVLALAGVLMVSDIDWRSVHLLRGKYLFGNLLLFLSCWGASFYNTYGKRLLRTFSPLEVMVYSFIGTVLILLPLMLLWEPASWSRLAHLQWTVWLSLIVIAVFSLSLSTVLFFAVLQQIDVTQAILSVYMAPVFGVVISALIVKEKITIQLIVGGALVFLGTLLVTYYEERLKRRVAPVAANACVALDGDRDG
ncbi:MAG: DMT family transporter [Bryobacterales bacterium]|nr:DMT family transporter [Bryobacterales bacterium]